MGGGRGEQVMMTNVFFVCPGRHRCFDILDVNGDGGVNLREFLKVPVFNSMSGHFYKLDTDKSGELDREEFIRGTFNCIYLGTTVFVNFSYRTRYPNDFAYRSAHGPIGGVACQDLRRRCEEALSIEQETRKLVERS